MRRFLSFFLLPALAGCVLFAWSRLAASPAEQAASIAAGRPYCVQVPGGADYRPASREDGPGRRMWGHGGVHHAVLVVGDGRLPDTWHWSYLKNRFVEGSYGPFPVVCTPVRDYFHRTPRHSSGTAFMLLGRRLDIPVAYRARAMWPGDLVGYAFYACAPDFEPGDDACAGQFWHAVEVAFSGGAAPQGMAYGVVDKIRAEPIAGPGPLPGLHEYVEFDEGGRVRSYIGCERSVGTDCIHVFSHAGLTFRFRHPRAALPHWRAMQTRLLQLHAGFER